jgi:hypothetical protein
MQWHVDTKGLGGLDIDDELEFCGLSQQHSCSFDHLVGAGEQRRGHFNAKRPALNRCLGT